MNKTKYPTDDNREDGPGRSLRPYVSPFVERLGTLDEQTLGTGPKGTDGALGTGS